MKRKTKLTLLISIISICTIMAQAPMAPPPPQGCEDLPGGCGPPAAPIDTGILYLLLAGAYVGVKKLRKN